LSWYVATVLVGSVTSIHNRLLNDLNIKLENDHLGQAINLAGAFIVSLLFSLPGITSLIFKQNEEREPFKPWISMMGSFQIIITYLLCAGVSLNCFNGRLGFMLFNCGLLATGSIIDHYGLYKKPRRKISWKKVGAILIFVSGLGVAAFLNFGKHTKALPLSIDWYILVFPIGGFFLACFWVLSLRVSRATEYSSHTVTLNFITAIPIILLISGINHVIFRGAVPLEFKPLEWYEYGVGSLEYFKIICTIVALPKIGFVTFTMFSTSALFMTQVMLDLLGLLTPEVRKLTPGTNAGMVLIILGCFAILYFNHLEKRSFDNNSEWESELSATICTNSLEDDDDDISGSVVSDTIDVRSLEESYQSSEENENIVTEDNNISTQRLEESDNMSMDDSNITTDQREIQEENAFLETLQNTVSNNSCHISIAQMV